MGDGDDDKGLVTNAMEGLIPGAIMGFITGSARAYLSGISDAQRISKIEALKSSSRPPSAAAIAALTPTPPLRAIASATALFAAVGAIFKATDPMVRGMRSGKDDIWNGAVAGCAAGSVVGLHTGTVQGSVGACAAFAAMSAFIETVGVGPTLHPTEGRRKAVYGAVAEE